MNYQAQLRYGNPLSMAQREAIAAHIDMLSQERKDRLIGQEEAAYNRGFADGYGRAQNDLRMPYK